VAVDLLVVSASKYLITQWSGARGGIRIAMMNSGFRRPPDHQAE
jgi:hypothetical protein